jgi:hypothetical protein
MSHHLDSPLARQDVRLDITDLYLFRGASGTVFVMNTNNSIAGPDAPKRFHPEARYEFRIDTDGDAQEDLVYRVTFGPADRGGNQAVELHGLSGAEARDPTAIGTRLASGTTDRPIAEPGGPGASGATGGTGRSGGAGGLKLWAGLAADPFYVDLTFLQTVAAAMQGGTAVDSSGWLQPGPTNLFAGTNVQSIVLEVPDERFAGLLGAERRIGAWVTTHLATDAGGWRPINRAGLPMIHPIFNPQDGERASLYNTTHPSEDRARYGPLFAGLIASVVGAQETAADPAVYGALVADLLLPDILPYRIGSPAGFSLAARNGRALTDNAPEVMISLVTGAALSTGLTRRDASRSPRDRFPYLAAPILSTQPAVPA